MAKSTCAIDPAHSEIGFKVKHMMFTNVSGKFNVFEATIENEDDNFESSKIKFSTEAASIDTRNSERDNHLRSADFFDVDNFPKIYFASTGIRTVDKNNYEVEGDLTIRGVTKNITLAVSYSGPMKDPWGNIKTGFSLSSKINRKDFGLTWNAVLESGGVLVSEEIKIVSEVQFVKQ